MTNRMLVVIAWTLANLLAFVASGPDGYNLFGTIFIVWGLGLVVIFKPWKRRALF